MLVRGMVWPMWLPVTKRTTRYRVASRGWGAAFWLW